MASEDRLRELEEKYENYTVYDNQGSKIGKVDDLFVDEADREEYIGVKLGLLGRKSTLIPMEIIRVNESERSVEVSDTKDHVKDAPSFDDDEDITSDYEDRIRSHFGLDSPEGSSRGGYGAYSGTSAVADDESRGYATTDDSAGYDERSSADAGRTGSGAQGGGSGEVPEYSGSGETSEGGSSIGSTAASSDETTREVPTTRQTEETETFQEGGRTKVRRRIVREEIIEEDGPSS